MNFDKTGYQLTLFPLQPSTSDELIMELGLCRESHLFLKNLYKFKDLELTDSERICNKRIDKDHFE